jgi:hypothetical protein
VPSDKPAVLPAQVGLDEVGTGGERALKQPAVVSRPVSYREEGRGGLQGSRPSRGRDASGRGVCHSDQIHQDAALAGPVELD